jgi:hypothetical protein
VDEAYHTERLDFDLAQLVPKETDVVKVPALNASRTRYLGIGDIGIRGFPYLLRALHEIIPNRGVDVVMITGSPFYPFLLAKYVKRYHHRPVILDFQDPWISKRGASRTPLTKAWAAHQLAKLLEPIAVRYADFVTSVSDQQNIEFAKHYPSFPKDQFAAIPIGGDTSDYMHLRAFPPTKLEVSVNPDIINISYIGTALPRSQPLLEIVFAAVAKLVASGEQWIDRLQLNFIGTSNQPNGFGMFMIRSLAPRHGIERVVHEVPQRVPYLQALDILVSSQAVLLIGSDEPHYTASKIYPALMSGRPILALFHKKSSAFEILNRSGGARVFGFSNHEELLAMTGAVANALRDIALEPHSIGLVDRSVVADYEADVIARRYAAIFERLAV